MAHKPIPEECKGCDRVVDHNGEECCSSYIDPNIWWTYGRRCPLASHLTKEVEEEFKLNPLKKSKRQGGNRPMIPTRKYIHGSHKRKKYVEGG